MPEEKLKFLHLEDNLSDAELIRIEIERSFDARIYHTTKKDEFVRLLKEEVYDIILCDFDVPGFHLSEAFQLVQQLGISIPFIYVSGAVGEERAIELLRSGVRDYVIKTNLGKLSLAIKRALEEVNDQRFKESVGAKISESEKRYRGLFEKMNEGLLLSCPEGSIKMVNPSFSKMLEYSEDELIGKIGYDILVDSSVRSEILDKVESRRNGKSEQYELDLITKSGKTIHTQISASPHYNSNGEFVGIMSIITNITGRKKAEKENRKMKEAFMRKLEIEVSERTSELAMAKIELQKSLAKEKELNELKSRFVSTASHQFRTPLTVINSCLAILAMYEDKMGEEFKLIFNSNYTRIQSQINRMTGVMNDVLIIGKINTGNIKPVFGRIDLVELCTAIAESYNQIQMDGRQMELVVEGDPYSVLLDASLIEHSISNFVSNAFKYSENCAPPMLKIYFGKEEVMVTVKDFGCGIPEKELSNLFDPFFRASNVDDVQGTGLGTTIAKDYIELNGGAVEVHSEINVGSEFIITFKI